MSVSTPFLHTIQPVSEDRPAEAVAREILALIRSEYRYTIADLCRMFCCERQWIEDFLSQTSVTFTSITSSCPISSSSLRTVSPRRNSPT